MATRVQMPTVFPADAKDVIGAIRGLITIRKQMSTVRDVQMDYRSMEGENIPFRKFGYPSLEDFLKASGEFSLLNRNDEVIVSMKLSQASAHIAALVRGQKSSGPPKSKARMIAPMRRNPMPSSNQQQQRYNLRAPAQQWRPVAPQQYNQYEWRPVQQVPVLEWRQVAPPPLGMGYGNYGPMTRTNNNMSYNLPSSMQQQPIFRHPVQPPLPKPIQRPPQPVQQKPQSAPPVQQKPQPSVQPNPPPSLQSRLQAAVKNPVQSNTRKVEDSISVTITNDLAKLTVHSTSSAAATKKERTVTTPNKNKPPSPTVKSSTPSPPNRPSGDSRNGTANERRETTKAKYTRKPCYTKPNTAHISHLLLDKIPDNPKKPISQRLQIRSPEISSASEPNESLDSSSLASRSVTDGLDPMAKLILFCKENDIPPPIFTMLSKGQFVACKVEVGDQVHCAWPGECDSDEQAKQTAARCALAQLSYKKQQPIYHPMVAEEDLVVVHMICEMLRAYPQGIVETAMPDVFQQTFGQSLPDHWTSIIATYKMYFTLERGPNQFLVYANEDPEEEAHAKGEQMPTMSDDEEEEEELDGELNFPWGEPYWNLYVTYANTTTSIWGRIIGSEHSGRLEEVMVEIETAMAEEKNRKLAEVVEVEKIYLITTEKGGWSRVRCQQLEETRALLFMVDVGTEEWMPLDKIYECNPRFIRVPGQALQFAMYGMESFTENPHAEPLLKKMLEEKAIVAEILTREPEYAHGAKIKTILYDTSGEEDVNIVEVLQTQICAATPPVRLQPTGVTQVNVSYITDRGDVFCRVRNRDLDYIEKLIETMVQNREAMEVHKGLKENPKGAGDESSRYLALDQKTGVWYRAVLKVRHPQTKDHMMYCLDHGCQIMAKEEDIYFLDPLSLALSKYPALAIRCQMYDVKEVNSQTVARLKGLLPLDSMALVKVMTSSSSEKAPSINIYLRREAGNIECINYIIKMEQELETALSLP